MDHEDKGPPPLLQWVKATQNTLHNLTVKKYGVPDKTVASQLLMYRQLLHTACKPSLKLSRDYQGTPAQVAVLHQPWWSQTVENGVTQTMVETGKMVISYDNLITRLWNTGVLRQAPSSVDTTDLPPIPHDDWIRKLGFQQADPVTDFRSGGVLSLAMMVYMVESCPKTFARFCEGGDAEVLPFGITSINITDLLAKLFLLSKRTDRMEALLSQKPFWQMFADPSAILVCQNVAMDMLADVVVELNQQNKEAVTVFDFARILRITEHRVEYDLLGAGPVSVAELRRTYQQLRRKYKTALEKKLGAGDQAPESTKPKKAPPMMGLMGAVADKMASTKIVDQAGKVAGQATVATGSILSNVVAHGASLSQKVMNKNKESNQEETTIHFESTSPPAPSVKPQDVDLLGGDWVAPNQQTSSHEITTGTDFQIGDEEDDFLL